VGRKGGLTGVAGANTGSENGGGGGGLGQTHSPMMTLPRVNGPCPLITGDMMSSVPDWREDAAAAPGGWALRGAVQGLVGIGNSCAPVSLPAMTGRMTLDGWAASCRIVWTAGWVAVFWPKRSPVFGLGANCG
jgi:hypothetical protein